MSEDPAAAELLRLTIGLESGVVTDSRDTRRRMIELRNAVLSRPNFMDAEVQELVARAGKSLAVGAEEAERIARRDLPGILIALDALLPVPLSEMAARSFEDALRITIQGLEDGTIWLTPDKRFVMTTVMSIGFTPRAN